MSTAVSPPHRSMAQDRLAEERLWRRCAAGDRAARDDLIERYMPLARMLARRYMRTSEPLEDLEQVGCLGLVQAVDRFDPARGTAFTSFAMPTILGELKRHFRDRTWSIRVPRQIREAAMSVARVSTSLATELGRTPSAREVAEATGLTVELVLEAREAALAYRCDSLDRPIGARGEDGVATLGDRLPEQDDALTRAEDVLLIDQLAASALPPREREIVRLRFSEDLLQREIAERVGLSQMHVSRVLRTALHRLREQATHDGAPVERAEWRPDGPLGRERSGRNTGSSTATRDHARRGVDLAAHPPRNDRSSTYTGPAADAPAAASRF